MTNEVIVYWIFLFEVSHGKTNMDGVPNTFVIYTDHTIFVHMKYFVYQIISSAREKF